MADLHRRLPQNVPGEFFVDSRCIDCDACRQLAPAVFHAQDGYSVVAKQPATTAERRAAIRASLACPTGSIGAAEAAATREVIRDFPLQLEDAVYYCGFNSPKSFGGNSYFVRQPQGNWLIDSPRFTHHLVKAFEEVGGIRYVFLSHRDDVADADRFARHFGAHRIIHRHEVHAQPGSEIVLDGEDAIAIAPEFMVIPTPGHTRGHCCLLFRNRFLFTGDHLGWDRDEERLDASRDYCWYSWPQQRESLAKLLDYSFDWVLPGHGQRVKLDRATMHEQLQQLVFRSNRR